MAPLGSLYLEQSRSRENLTSKIGSQYFFSLEEVFVIIGLLINVQKVNYQRVQ